MLSYDVAFEKKNILYLHENKLEYFIAPKFLKKGEWNSIHSIFLTNKKKSISKILFLLSR